MRGGCLPTDHRYSSYLEYTSSTRSWPCPLSLISPLYKDLRRLATHTWWLKIWYQPYFHTNARGLIGMMLQSYDWIFSFSVHQRCASGASLIVGVSHLVVSLWRFNWARWRDLPSVIHILLDIFDSRRKLETTLVIFPGLRHAVGPWRSLTRG